MDKFKAEKIINQYGAAIARGSEAGNLRKKSLLPCTKAKIKLAYFIYIDALIKEFGPLQEKIGENLVMTYSMLNAFIDDIEIEKQIIIYKEIKEKKLVNNKFEDKEKIDKYFAFSLKAMRDGELFDEINEYIGECYKKARIK